MLITTRATVEGLIHAIRETVRQWRARRARFKVALAFNRLHTFSWSSQQWMCPCCNAVHRANGTSPFSGLQYPSCCRHPEGQRHGRDYATAL